MVGITAGEAGNPRQAVPRAIRQVFWRILIFYVGMMFFIGILIPWNDKRLLSKGSKTAKSPLTIALSDAGINAGASIINAVIVIAVVSAGNSSLYVSSRTMLFMARNGKAPKILGMVNKAGVPWVALLFSNLVACIAFLSVSKSGGTIYDALITLSGVTTFIVWQVQICHHLIDYVLMSATGGLLKSCISVSVTGLTPRANQSTDCLSKPCGIPTALTPLW